MNDLWGADDAAAWRSALGFYARVVAAQGVRNLVEHDRWFSDELPQLLAARRPASVTLDELARVAEWKMHRGVYRARNLALIRTNTPEQVEATSRAALAAVPDPDRPIALLSGLKGVGPATASAIASAARPDVYPFFDELVAEQVPGLGPVDFSPRYYRRYAEALRERAARLGHDWTPSQVERALWAFRGGKAGAGALSKL